MPNSMYHVHVIKVAGEYPIASSEIALFFENRAFLTYDLPALLPESGGYSRRCIDKCDCVLMVVGQNYGEKGNLGVSQLHLSYLAAKTKNKPILIFVSKLDERTSRRVVDFVNLLQAQNTQHLYHFENETMLSQQLKNFYDDFQQTLSLRKWTRMDAASPFSANDVIPPQPGKTNNTGKATDRLSLTTTSSTAANVAAKTNPVPHQDLPEKELFNSIDLFDDDPLSLFSKTPNASKKRSVSIQNVPIQNVPIQNAPRQNVAKQNVSVQTASKQNVSKQSVPKQVASAQNAMHIDNKEWLLVDELIINYHAHAYQDGNLSDVSLSMQLKWTDVVKVLTKFKDAFSTDNMYRSLNDFVSIHANDTVKKTMPNVHAISRCQVCPMDFEWICSQLIYNKWIESTAVGASDKNCNTSSIMSHKKVWQLTDTVKNELEFLASMI